MMMRNALELWNEKHRKEWKILISVVRNIPYMKKNWYKNVKSKEMRTTVAAWNKNYDYNSMFARMSNNIPNKCKAYLKVVQFSLCISLGYSWNLEYLLKVTI